MARNPQPTTTAPAEKTTAAVDTTTDTTEVTQGQTQPEELAAAEQQEQLDQTQGTGDATQEKVDEPAAAPAPAVQEQVAEEAVLESPAPVAKTEEVQEIKGVDPLIVEVLPKVGTAAQLALHEIAEYMLSMQPKKPIQHDAGARKQVVLYRAIVRLINNTGDDFQTAFSTLLNLFHKHRAGVFHETSVFRFTEHIGLNKEESTSFLRLLNLLKLTADPKGRGVALKQVRLEDTLEFGINDAGKQRILEFFNK